MVNWDRADGGREAIFVDESTMIFLFFNRKFPIFPIFSILSFLFSYFPIFLSNHAAGHPDIPYALRTEYIIYQVLKKDVFLGPTSV